MKQFPSDKSTSPLSTIAETTLTRRTLLKSAGVAGGGLLLGFSLTGCSGDEVIPPALPQQDGVFTPNAFLQVTEDNEICFYCAREEMGQGIATGLATLVAEELDVDPLRITLRFVGAHPDYRNPDFHMQITGGSTSLASHYFPLRQAAANARAMLLQAAAAELGVDAGSLATDNGNIVHGAQRYPYGDFANVAGALELPADAELKPAEQFIYIGKQNGRIDNLVKSNGEAKYGIDVQVPGMSYATVKRCPVIGGRVKNFDDSKARNMPGVTDVVEVKSGVAVVAEKFWQAKKAADAIEVEWKYPRYRSVDTASLEQDYQQAMDEGRAVTDKKRGEVEQGFSAADKIIERQYRVPMLAHSPLEPMNAVLKVDGDRADIWVGSQMPPTAQAIVANSLGLDTNNVTVHGAYLGGGFGRRATLTHVYDLAEIVGATGKTIKLVMSREDDIRSGHYRPASLMKIKAGVRENGEITGWTARRVGGNLTPHLVKAFESTNAPQFLPDAALDIGSAIVNQVYTHFKIDHNSVEGLKTEYDIPNVEIQHVTVDHGIPLTFWRSVGHSYTAFAKESMIDELAEQVGVDPLEFRLRRLGDNKRLYNVVNRLKQDLAGRPLPAGQFRGIASHYSFSTDVAQAADVSIENGQIRVHRVHCVVDCGLAVNPDIVRAQMEGGIVFGLTAALYGKLDLEKGAVTQSNFHDYRLLRMNEAPAIDVTIIESDDKPTGVGEPGLPPIAPAVANAVYRATGQRLRELPFKLA